MTVRGTIAGTVLRAKLAIRGFGVLAILTVAVAGCSPSSSSVGNQFPAYREPLGERHGFRHIDERHGGRWLLGRRGR